MSNARHYSIRNTLRLACAYRAGLELLFRVAAQVSTRARLAICRVRYAQVVLWTGSPSSAAVLQYVAPKALHAAVGKLFRSGASRPSPSQTASRYAPRNKNRPGPPTPKLPRAAKAGFLADARARRLQRSIVAGVLRLRFGLHANAEELAVLSRFSSVAWLARNLEVAGGVHGARLTEAERRHRVRVVYPVFFKLMRFHLGFAASGAQTTVTRAERLWLRLRYPGSRSSLGPNGRIVQSLYPEEITAEQIRTRRTVAAEQARRRYRALRNREHLLRFELYLEALSLAARPRRAAAEHAKGSARLARAVHRVTAEFHRRSTRTVEEDYDVRLE